MDVDLLAALFGFALTASMTPGPNNVMLMASGANFGVRRSLPHAAGITIGFSIMIALVGHGLGRAFDLWPSLRIGLAVVSAGYLAWLAWKIATAAPPGSRGQASRPLSLLQAAGFQWVNPKAWTMAVSAITLFAKGTTGPFVVAAVFGAVSVVSTATWLVAGTQVRRLLDSPGRLRAFNRAMAALLVASLWPAVGPLLRG